jgi:hypothetical protein
MAGPKLCRTGISIVVLVFDLVFVIQLKPKLKPKDRIVTTEIRIPLSSIVNNPYNFSHEFSSFLIQQALQIMVVITRYATVESNERNLSLDDVQENNKIA